MKTKILIYPLVMIGLVYLLAGSCKKKEDTGPIAQVPVLTTGVISSFTETTASCGGTITSPGSDSVTARGVCWSIYEAPTTLDGHTSDGNGTGNFTSTITGLTFETQYYVRAFAINSAGTAYGNQVSFTTSLETVTDIDGNVYHTVTIGTQKWLVENLKTTRLNNGTPIPLVESNFDWINLSAPGYCWYYLVKNLKAAPYPGELYGALYNWYAVNTGKLAPAGWHVPTDAEWTILVDYLGGETIAGGKMKEAGTAHWTVPNESADNSSGFSGLPGGIRASNNGFSYNYSTNGFWWSATDASPYYGAFLRQLYYNYGGITYGNASKESGLSVRCVKD